MAKKKTQYKNEIVLTEEFFELRLVCNTDTIDVFSLIKYLNQANYMVQGINKTLNKNFNVGYDAIEVEVFAVEHGSIRIPLKLKKYAANTLMGLATTIIGGVAVNLISGNKEPIVIISDIENIETQPSTFLDNQQTKRSVGKIAKMVVEDDGISGLEVTYEKSDGQRESLTIKKTTLDKVAKECEDTTDDIINNYSKTRLQIHGPILENTPSVWWVIMNGQKLRAFMTDKDFLEEMTAKKIAFAPGDEIIADIEEVISEDEQGTHIKRYIRRVHSYPKYTRVVKGVKQQSIIE
ncbi:hypothetical protein [Coprobacter sp.]|uniref:hypothetical protein n=1 Tax=Coprobacter sp. TaxID=1941478 RepID=UPI003AB5B99A